MLSDGEKCGCKLLERFEITQPTLFHDEFSGNIVANSLVKFFLRQLDRWKIRPVVSPILVLFTSDILPSHVHNKS
jgi:hypothetical protein